MHCFRKNEFLKNSLRIYICSWTRRNIANKGKLSKNWMYRNKYDDPIIWHSNYEGHNRQECVVNELQRTSWILNNKYSQVIRKSMPIFIIPFGSVSLFRPFREKSFTFHVNNEEFLICGRLLFAEVDKIYLPVQTHWTKWFPKNHRNVKISDSSSYLHCPTTKLLA